METDDIDGSSNQANEKDDAEEAASEEIDGSLEPTTEKDDVSTCFFSSFRICEVPQVPWILRPYNTF